MSKAFLDTTIIVDILLKESLTAGKQAKEALKQFGESELPVYSLKEFKSGPLNCWVWLYNKLQHTQSLPRTLIAIKQNMSYRKNLPATALEAIAQAAEKETEDLTSQDLVDRYGGRAKIGNIQVDSIALMLRTVIFKAWRKRRKVTTRVIQEITCWVESGPELERSSRIVLRHRKCDPKPECSLAKCLRQDIKVLQALLNATERPGLNAEGKRRAKAIKSIIKRPTQMIEHNTCRNLGDAIFAFFCPEGSTILTTNLRDHEPLAIAVGKNVTSPTRLL